MHNGQSPIFMTSSLKRRPDEKPRDAFRGNTRGGGRDAFPDVQLSCVPLINPADIGEEIPDFFRVNLNGVSYADQRQ